MELMAQLLGVTAHQQSLGRCDECLDTVPPRPGRIPGQRLAGLRVERGDAGTLDRAWAGVVDTVAVVHPALVATDVHGGTGDGRGQQRVAAGPVHPGRVLRSEEHTSEL